MHINLLKLFFFYCFLYICVVHITDIHQFMLEVIRIMFSFFYFHVNHSLKTRKNRIFPPPISAFFDDNYFFQSYITAFAPKRPKEGLHFLKRESLPIIMVADTYGPSWGKSGNLRLKKIIIIKKRRNGGREYCIFSRLK